MTACAVRLERVPALRRVSPPALTPTLADAVRRERVHVDAHPHHFDGALLAVLEATAEEIVVFESSFALERARDRAGAGGALGSLGVGLVLGDGRGRLLWQRRGPAALHPGSWAVSAAGVVEPGADPLTVIVAEAEEEIGLPPAGIAGLRPWALTSGDGIDGAQILFCARLEGTARPVARPPEVAEIAWSQEPGALQPLGAQTRAILAALAAAGIDLAEADGRR